MRRRRETRSIDAPPGRYRVEEKDGRLVVVDSFTGIGAATAAALRPRRPEPGAA